MLPITSEIKYVMPGEVSEKYLDPKDGESLIKRAEHIFKEILPPYGYAVRDKQIELAQHILTVAGKRGITLAESEVGTGKTLAYLIAAALIKRGRLNDSFLRGHYPNQSYAASANMPVIISTSSIALQNAIIKDYIPELSKILLKHGVIRSPLTAVIRKGKEHYICEKRLQRFYSKADEEIKTLLYPFLDKHSAFDMADNKFDGFSSYIKRNICVSGRCNDDCPRFEKCRYSRYIKKATNATIDFQVTNHNFFLADTRHRAEGKCPLLPNYQLAIIDEAHKFLSAARSMYGLELAECEIYELCGEIHSFTFENSSGGVNVHKLTKKLEGQGQRLFRKLTANIPEEQPNDETERYPAIFDSDVDRHLKNISSISQNLIYAIEDSRIQEFHKSRRATALWKLNELSERAASLRKQAELIFWLEKEKLGDRAFSTLHSIPKDIDVRLHKDLWSKGIPIILTSGTLSASGDFTRAKETLGLDKIPQHKLFSATMASPFDYKNNTLLYISETTLFPDNNKEYLINIANEIEKLIKASNGHAAVLFTSYNAMGQVHTILKSRNLPFPMFRLERGGVNAIEKFKKSGNGVLLASGALWEGIDIPGDTLSMLIIVKLPFAVPDSIGDYERSLCGNIEEYKAKAIVPDMLVKLKQGFGRLIRSETDTGVCAILDSRVNSHGSYRSKVLATLPECRVTSDILEVREFICCKKSRGYFR